MTSWRKTKYILWGFLSFYFLVSIATSFTKTGELFPIFNRHWFYKTPNEFRDYGLLVYKLDQKELIEPLYVEKIYAQLAVWPFSAYGAIQKLGEATENQSPDQATQMRAMQKLIFGARSFKAQLVKRKMNPLDFVLHNTTELHQVLIDVEN